jgi:hypothetical protein
MGFPSGRFAQLQQELFGRPCLVSTPTKQEDGKGEGTAVKQRNARLPYLDTFRQGQRDPAPTKRPMLVLKARH